MRLAVELVVKMCSTVVELCVWFYASIKYLYPPVDAGVVLLVVVVLNRSRSVEYFRLKPPTLGVAAAAGVDDVVVVVVVVVGRPRLRTKAAVVGASTTDGGADVLVLTVKIAALGVGRYFCTLSDGRRAMAVGR